MAASLEDEEGSTVITFDALTRSLPVVQVSTDWLHLCLHVPLSGYPHTGSATALCTSFVCIGSVVADQNIKENKTKQNRFSKQMLRQLW